ncbi:MAG: response regulator [Gemmatimonadota bacterium]
MSSALSDSNTGATGARVLVVDDSVDACDSLAAVVRMLGHDARTAFDGQQAVEEAAAFKPQLILMDISLPRLTGYEAAAIIRGQDGGADIVLVALTGWGRDEDRREALAHGFQHHVTKPIDFDVLKKLLDGVTRSIH